MLGGHRYSTRMWAGVVNGTSYRLAAGSTGHMMTSMNGPEADDVQCTACGHPKSRHAIWNPGFVGCYECKECPQWTPPPGAGDEAPQT